MSREAHVRFCEGRGVKLPPATRLNRESGGSFVGVVQTPEDRPGVAQSDRWGDDFDRFGVGSQLGAVRWRASMVTCQRRCRRLPKRFSDRWGLWHFRPVLYSKRPQRSRKPWKVRVNRVESLSKPLGSCKTVGCHHRVME
jgi:hypothetical protein